jgi:hypothetical protein
MVGSGELLCRAKWRLWSVPDQMAGVKSMCLAIVSTEDHLSTMALGDIRCEEEKEMPEPDSS